MPKANFSIFQRAPKVFEAPKEPKHPSQETVEVLCEQDYLKLRDREKLSHDESPCYKLQHFAMDEQIRPVVPAGVEKYMLFFPLTHAEKFVVALEKVCPDFQQYVRNTLEAYKNREILETESSSASRFGLPSWR